MQIKSLYNSITIFSHKKGFKKEEKQENNLQFHELFIYHQSTREKSITAS